MLRDYQQELVKQIVSAINRVIPPGVGKRLILEDVIAELQKTPVLSHSVEMSQTPIDKLSWHAGDYAIYDGEKFIPYVCYDTESVDKIVKENIELQKQLSETQQKLDAALNAVLLHK